MNKVSKYAEQLANELMQFYSNIDIDSEDYLNEDDFRTLGDAVDILNDYAVYLAKKEVANSGDFYTRKDCSNEDYYENQILVLKPEALSADYRQKRYQLFYATGGFGVDPTKMGRAVYGYFLDDGESTRMNREDFYGVLKDSLVTPEIRAQVNAIERG